MNDRVEANLPGKLPMALLNEEISSETTIQPNSYCADIFRKLQQGFQTVQQNFDTANRKLAQAEDIPKYFEVGDEVYLFSPVLHVNEPKAFKVFWTGPFQIIRQISPVVFRIQHSIKPSIQLSVHVSRLKKKF